MTSVKGKIAGQDVALTDETSRAVATTDFAGDAEQYQEKYAAQDLSIPFLTIIQGMSPQIKRTHAKYVEGALPGMIFNTITQRLIPGDVGLPLIPVMYERCFIEWIQRDDGGGFVAKYPVEQGEKALIQRNDSNKPIIMAGSPVGTPGNELVETASHVVLDLYEGAMQPAIISMSSTQLKKSRDWNYNLSQRTADIGGKIIKPARFFWVYKFTTIGESKKDYSWDGWKITPIGDVRDLPNGDEVYAAAKKLRDDLTAGAVTVDYSKADRGAGDGAAGEREGDKAPF